MQSQYAEFESEDSFDDNSDDGADDSEDSYEENVKFQFDPYSTFTGVPTKLFGTDTPYGQSLGLNIEDAQLEDGAVYVNPDNGTYKMFGWQDIVGRPVADFVNDGRDFHASQANEFMSKTYGSNTISYELVMARVPEHSDEDGNVIVEPSAIAVDDDGDVVEIDPETVSLPNLIIWISGQDRPTAAAKTTAKIMSSYGSDVTEDESDVNNWLADTSHEDFLREDLQGRRLTFFKIKKQARESGNTFYHQIIVDTKTGSRLVANNGGGETSSDEEGGVDAPTSSPSNGDTPAPVQDFKRNASQLDLGEKGAMNLLNDMISSDGPMTEAMVESAGGAEALVNEVLHP